MNDDSDADLLKRFALDERDEAFAQLVNRYINLVYSVALRHTKSAHDAQEITQAVFIILARKAPSLGGKTALSGWLYHTAWLTAANFRRVELRRTLREQEAYMQTTLEEAPNDVTWQELVPYLDDTLAALGKRDRDAIVLRYFENKSLQEVAQKLGVEERAAQKRVSRALEKLRLGFTKHGVVWPATVLAGAISANSVQAAPVPLAKIISATAFKGSVGAGSTMTLVKGTLNYMNWIKLKIVGAMIVSSVVVAAAAITLTDHHNSRAGSSQAQSLREKQEAERAGVAPNGASNVDGASELEAEAKALQEKQNEPSVR
jgi:RNA polymerase sigma factor (sigma-70 family)